jgi:hypothetical protein
MAADKSDTVELSSCFSRLHVGFPFGKNENKTHSINKFQVRLDIFVNSTNGDGDFIPETGPASLKVGDFDVPSLDGVLSGIDIGGEVAHDGTGKSLFLLL